MEGLDDVEMGLVTLILTCKLEYEHDDRKRQYRQPVRLVNARCGLAKHLRGLELMMVRVRGWPSVSILIVVLHMGKRLYTML